MNKKKANQEFKDIGNNYFKVLHVTLWGSMKHIFRIRKGGGRGVFVAPWVWMLLTHKINAVAIL